MKKSKRTMSAQELDTAFDQGKDMMKWMDKSSAKVQHPIQRVNIDIPIEILQKVDHEATRVGVTRTSLIKLWIAEHADHLTQ